jgi:hypothetical protein
MSEQPRTYFDRYSTIDVTSFEIIGDYTLRIHFADSTEQIINFEPFLNGEVFLPLRDLTYFNQVFLEDGNIHWPNEVDFDPGLLHDWHLYEAEMLKKESEVAAQLKDA